DWALVLYPQFMSLFWKVNHRWPSTRRLRSSLRPPASRRRTLGFWEALARLAARVLPAGPPKHNVASVFRTGLDLIYKCEWVNLTANDDKIIGLHVDFFKVGL